MVVATHPRRFLLRSMTGATALMMFMAGHCLWSWSARRVDPRSQVLAVEEFTKYDLDTMLEVRSLECDGSTVLRTVG